MADTMELGALKVRLITHDEVALLARYSVLHAVDHPELGVQVRRTIRSLLPVLPLASRALILDAMPQNIPAWAFLRNELLA